MKRSGIFILILFSMVFSALRAGALSIKNTKHDLSALSTGGTYTAKAAADSGTTEICVFCHTPHSARPEEAPLWNRVNPEGPYTVYGSDVITALSYTAKIETPAGTGSKHAKTRICLSCHDGTIALGSVVNLPPSVDNMFYNEIQMQGPSKIQPAAPGYIGTDLRDDHPVAAKHEYGTLAGQDPELQSTIQSLNYGGPVYLYTDASAKTQVTDGAGYVECTSCHNPHDNQYGKFLVGANDQSKLCIACHNKTGFNLSSHNTATQPYSPSTGGTPPTIGFPGNTVGDVKCMNCHYPHKAAATGSFPNFTENPAMGYYLLTYAEEKSCFNNPDRWSTGTGFCHGSPGVKNIETEVAVAKASKHQVDGFSNLHRATEAKTSGWASGGLHVECADCHNPHTAGNTIHTRGQINGNRADNASSPLSGTGGVKRPSTAPNWPAPPYIDTSAPTSVWNASDYIEPKGLLAVTSTGVTYEYEICYKCHTDFAWGSSTPPNAPSLGLGKRMTNQALEFKTSNPAYHPIEAATGRNATVTFIPPWNVNRGTQTMYCADCHTKEGDLSPSGTHGSTISGLLRSAYTNTYSTTTNAQQPPNELCAQCHPDSIYNTAATGDNTAGTNFWTGSVNLHNRHATRATLFGSYAYRCVNCHVRVPHGYKNRGMVVLRGDGFPYEAGATNLGKITTYTPPAGNWNGTKGVDCLTAGGCH